MVCNETASLIRMQMGKDDRPYIVGPDAEFQQSGMEVGIIHGHPLGRGGGVEFLVGGNEGKVAKSHGEPSAMQLPGDGKLDCVVAQPVCLSQSESVGQQQWGDFQDVVLVKGVAAELGEDVRCGGGGHQAAAAPPGDGCADFDQRKAGEENLVSGGRVGHGPEPRACRSPERNA